MPNTSRGPTPFRSFFNFTKNNNDPSLQNRCDNPMMRKLFKISEIPQWKILGKEVVDEIIFRTIKPRNRLILFQA
jgi:hypothetical protein